MKDVWAYYKIKCMVYKRMSNIKFDSDTAYAEIISNDKYSK